jgi:hypothetical protein
MNLKTRHFTGVEFLNEPLFAVDGSIIALSEDKIQGDTKKRELLKCVVAAMYTWQHCGTGTLSYRQPRHLVIMDHSLKRQVVMVQFLSINFFCWISSIFVGFFKSSRFFVPPYT